MEINACRCERNVGTLYHYSGSTKRDWSLNNMSPILQMTFSNVFSWLTICEKEVGIMAASSDDQQLWYWLCRTSVSFTSVILTHWSRDKSAVIFPDDIFKCENGWISLRISLKFVLNDQINNIPELALITAWRRSDDKLLSEPMMASLLTHICVIRPQCVNGDKW